MNYWSNFAMCSQKMYYSIYAVASNQLASNCQLTQEECYLIF
jgi:hypothetical protein